MNMDRQHEDDAEKIRIGEVFIETVRRTDNWSPINCPLEELEQHLNDLSEIEMFLVELTGRAHYLRGILAARMVNELIK